MLSISCRSLSATETVLAVQNAQSCGMLNMLREEEGEKQRQIGDRVKRS
jgi:hypothetical protein